VEKNWKLDQTINDLRAIGNQEYVNVVTLGNALSELDLQLLELINSIIM
jgi:hypothetical protein